MEAVICILIVPAVFFGELRLKNRAEKYLTLKGGEQERTLFGGKVLLRRYHNRGAMLGLGEKNRAALAVLSCVLTAFLIPAFFFSLSRRGSRLLRLGLALLLGGALSNTYDRLKRKYVVDYFSFAARWKRLRGIVFNLADFCIFIGVLLTALGASD